MNIKFLIIFLIGAMNVGYSQSRTAQIDAYLQNYKSRIPFPGFSIVLVEGDQVVFSKAYGMEIEGQRKRMTTQTPIALGAVGRGFTAMAILQLVEEGKLQLDEPVVTYLPWFKTANKNFSDEITVRMCLNNTSAIPALSNFTPALDASETLEKFVRSMEGSYVKRKPGSSHEFSEEGYSIAGLLISELSAMPYGQYMEQHIFQPLEMKHTTTDPGEFESMQVSFGHELGLDKCIPAQAEVVNTHLIPGGSELRSSAEDLGKYLIALLNDGVYRGSRVLSAELVAELFTSDISFRGLGTMLGGNGLDIGYALGWMSMTIEDRSIIIHTGNTGTMASIVGLNPEKNQGIAILFNGDVNQLDRYVYPTLENTANNLIHILNGEDTTDFAVVRFEDPFDDDYTLPSEKWGSYVGHYSAYGKSNPFFKEMEIEVRVGEDKQLELLSKKAGVLKGHYKLQFSNETRAVLRSIAHPREIQFKLFPNGTIGGLFMFGSEFQKKNEQMETRYKELQDPNESISFLFPRTASGTWNGNQFSADLTEHQAEFKMQLTPLGSTDFESFVINNLPSAAQTTGMIKNENVRDCIWIEQSISAEVNGSPQHFLFVQYQDPIADQQAQIVIQMPWGSFSSDLQEVVMNVQKSIGF